MKAFYIATFILLFVCLTVHGQDTPRKIYIAKKVNPHAPTIDGNKNDVIWRKIKYDHDFTQRDPVEGAAVSEQTGFKICYDEQNLYVLINVMDSHPELIKTELARRDEMGDCDMVGIMLDTYFDRRTAFEFTVNASGVKYDAVYSNDSFDHDESWDPIWEARSSIGDSGWVAEMRIPLKQLRFAGKSSQIWGLQVYRYIQRNHEFDEWQPIPKDASGYISHFGLLKGISGIRPSRQIEILPYSVSKFHSYKKEIGNPFSSGQNYSVAGGLDGKIGLTGNLIVDFTINPDFGQVEADPSEVNLSAFETFFQEKRPFFIEGKSIFSYPLGLGDGDFARETLFYSRRVGGQPHYTPDTDDNEYLDMPEQTSILGAAKLSGKTDDGLSVGVLDAMTAREIADIDRPGERTRETVEPFTNYFVTRLQKDFDKGNTSLGGMITSTHRNIENTYLDFLNRSAYTGGIDFTHQWKDKTYFFDLKTAFSHVRGHQDAITEVQTASARYFQRPDANYLTLDSSKTSISGHGGSLTIGKQGSGHIRYMVSTIWRSPGLELNDVGYLRQADKIMQFIWVGYRVFNPVGIFKQISLNINQWNNWNFGGEKTSTGGNVNGGGQFNNYWGFWMGIGREEDGLSLSALRGGPAARYEGGWNNWFNIYSDSRKNWQITLDGSNYISDDGISHYTSLKTGLFLRPSSRLNLTFQPFFQKNRDNLQYIDTIEQETADRFIFGHLDQTTFGMVFRLNYSLTPDLSIQYYGQPFVSAGRYSRFKRITHPRANHLEDRYEEFPGDRVHYDEAGEEYYFDEDGDGNTDYSIGMPDFNFKQFRSNLVIRWEYHPGSQIYLVWSQGRTGIEEQGKFSFERDFRELFSVYPDNIFLIKFNHWFSI